MRIIAVLLTYIFINNFILIFYISIMNSMRCFVLNIFGKYLRYNLKRICARHSHNTNRIVS